MGHDTSFSQSAELDQQPWQRKKHNSIWLQQAHYSKKQTYTGDLNIMWYVYQHKTGTNSIKSTKWDAFQEDD